MVSNGSAAVRSGQLLAVLFLLFSPLLAQAGDGGVLSGEATEDAGASESTQSGGNNRGCLSGRVTDALTGEALAGAVAVLDSGHQAAATGADGRFRFCGLSAEEEQVEVVKTGYRTARVGPMALGAQPWASLKIQLQSMVFQEWVEVEPAEPPPAAGLFPQGLNRGEASRVTGTLDDPLRALTILPGVSTVNGQKAELRLRAGEPEDTQFHLDGVTLENPYHFRGARGSTTALNLEAFDSLEVTTAGLGAEVGNTTAGAVTLSPTERGRSGRFRETAVGTLTSRFSSGGPL
ncbi:MAG: carboxypeptidase regulatory-like domain-containing protein, partial [Acidobacteriota bacterium]